MRYLMGLMIVTAVLAGLGLVWAAVRDVFRRLAAGPRLRRTRGTVVDMHMQHVAVGSPRTGSSREPSVFPVVEFTPAGGSATRFRSAVGSSMSTSPHAIGQVVVVVYDPLGRLEPALDGFSSLWLPLLLQALGGLVFVGSGLGLAWLYGDKVLGR